MFNGLLGLTVTILVLLVVIGIAARMLFGD